MTPTAQTWLTRIARGLTLLYTLLIIALSLMPGQDVPLGNISDKYRHAAAYGVFAVLIGCSFLHLRWRSVIFAFVFASLFGVMIEIIQPTFHRTRDVYDALANAIGASIGCAALACAVIALQMTRSRTNPLSHN